MPGVVAQHVRRSLSSSSQSRTFAADSPSDRGHIVLGEKVLAATAAGQITFLPYLDRYTEETETIRRAYWSMLKSPVVKAALLGKIFAVAALDLQVHPVNEDDPRDRAVAEFVHYAYTQAAEGGLPKLLETILLPGLIDKFSVVEKVWDADPWPRGKWRGKRFYRAFKAKENVRLEQDEYRNITGVVSNRFGQGGSDPFDPRDFIIFRNLPLFEGVGMSDFRAAYGAYWRLDTVEKLRVIHLEKFTSPYFKGTYKDEDDRDELASEMEKAKSRSWIVIPDGAQLEALSIATRGEKEFDDAARSYKEDIALAIAGAFLQMLTAQGGGGEMRGDSQTQKSTSELFIWRLAATVCTLLDTQGTPDLVEMNFAGADYPTCSLGGINYAELKSGIEIEEIAQRMGAKLSQRAFAKKYGLQLASTPDDELRAAPAALPGGFGFTTPAAPAAPAASFEFAERPAAPPAAKAIERRLDQQSAPPGSDVGIAGADGRRALELLANAQRRGAARLTDLARATLAKLLAKGPKAVLRAKSIFSADQLADLADQITATNATADLLGRSRIRERAERVESRAAQLQRAVMAVSKRPWRFSDEPTTFGVFTRAFDEGNPLEPLSPKAAIEYFRKLVPSLNIEDVERWGELLERHAFTMAEAADAETLVRVQEAVRRVLATGQDVVDAPAAIDAILDEAGAGPRSAGYSEMVFRTNAMDAYNHGAQRELSEVSETFPVWRYANPDDGRSREEHAARNGLYFDSDTGFVEVRGADIGEVANCRCTFIPIDKYEWAELDKAGAKVQS